MTREEKKVFAKLGVYDHIHAEDRGCRCGALADEPHPDCPTHGHPWPPRCGTCGQFLPWQPPRPRARPEFMRA